MTKQVIAMGDGGIDAKNPLMDLYILAQSKKPIPKICFLPTAMGDNQGLIRYFMHVFESYPCNPDYFTFFDPRTADIEDFFMSQDIIYVGGGQSKSMLGVWREWGMERIFRAAYENGTILTGGSAGSVCWFDQCVTDSIPGRLTVMGCLGILPYSNCPHFSSPTRRESYSNFISSGEIKAGYAADDYAALHFVDGEFHRGVSNRPASKVYKFSMEDGRLVRKRLKTKFLGVREYQEELIFSSPMFANLSFEETAEETNTSTEVVVHSDGNIASENVTATNQAEDKA